MKAIVVMLAAMSGSSFFAGVCWAETPDAKTLAQKVVDAAGGKENLLTRFTIRERLNVSDDPDKPGKPRESVFDGHDDWWFRGNKGAWRKKKNEPAADLVWAWTLQALVDEKSKLASLPEINDGDQALVGLRVSGTIQPAMDVYFGKKSLQLARIDWRKDINRFSDWREHDGAKYPARCVGYRKATGKPWFVSEIKELRRLKTLPSDLKTSMMPLVLATIPGSVAHKAAIVIRPSCEAISAILEGGQRRSSPKNRLTTIRCLAKYQYMNTVFKALSDPTRRRVLELLKQRPMSAGELAAEFKVSKPTMSAHFAVLREANLVVSEKQGKTVMYQLQMSVLEEALLSFAQTFGWELKSNVKAETKRSDKEAYNE